MNRRNNSFGPCSVYGMIYITYRSLALFIAFASAAFAQEAPNLARPQIVVPEKIAGVNTVSAEQLIEILMSDSPPLLIDARIKQDRDYGFIENSISLPDIETNCDSLAKVAENKKQHLLFYCNGVQCGRSVISIKVARSCGYHNLSWFKGGFAEWKDKGYQYVKNK